MQRQPAVTSYFDQRDVTTATPKAQSQFVPSPWRRHNLSVTDDRAQLLLLMLRGGGRHAGVYGRQGDDIIVHVTHARHAQQSVHRTRHRLAI